MRVLIADPDSTTVDPLPNLLSDHGHEVQVAADVECCLESLDESRPDILLLESHLPTRGGRQVLERLLQTSNSPLLPVILVSDDIALFDPRAYPNLVGWIRKPYRLSDLLVLIDYSQTQWSRHKKKDERSQHNM